MCVFARDRHLGVFQLDHVAHRSWFRFRHQAVATQLPRSLQPSTFALEYIKQDICLLFKNVAYASMTLVLSVILIAFLVVVCFALFSSWWSDVGPEVIYFVVPALTLFCYFQLQLNVLIVGSVTHLTRFASSYAHSKTRQTQESQRPKH